MKSITSGSPFSSLESGMSEKERRLNEIKGFCILTQRRLRIIGERVNITLLCNLFRNDKIGTFFVLFHRTFDGTATHYPYSESSCTIHKVSLNNLT